MPTSDKESFWQEVIDRANNKYHTLFKFQNDLVQRAQNQEIITIPSGREYEFKLLETKRGWEWPLRDIVNWPNQGFANDLMSIMRVSLKNRLTKLEEYKEKKVLLINTVHDDVEADVDNNPDLCYNICMMMEKVCEDVPSNFEKLYKQPFKTPLAGEVSFDVNLKGTLWDEKNKDFHMRVFDKTKGREQFLI
jgi:DNA polymerase I-like protein with 3'-5' exonuclease and polymerase domains